MQEFPVLDAVIADEALAMILCVMADRVTVSPPPAKPTDNPGPLASLSTHAPS